MFNPWFDVGWKLVQRQVSNHHVANQSQRWPNVWLLTGIHTIVLYNQNHLRGRFKITLIQAFKRICIVDPILVIPGHGLCPRTSLTNLQTLIPRYIESVWKFKTPYALSTHLLLILCQSIAMTYWVHSLGPACLVSHVSVHTYGVLFWFGSISLGKLWEVPSIQRDTWTQGCYQMGLCPAMAKRNEKINKMNNMFGCEFCLFRLLHYLNCIAYRECFRRMIFVFS